MRMIREQPGVLRGGMRSALLLALLILAAPVIEAADASAAVRLAAPGAAGGTPRSRSRSLVLRLR